MGQLTRDIFKTLLTRANNGGMLFGLFDTLLYAK